MGKAMLTRTGYKKSKTFPFNTELSIIMEKIRWTFISVFGAIFFGVVLRYAGIGPSIALPLCALLGFLGYLFFRRMNAVESERKRTQQSKLD